MITPQKLCHFNVFPLENRTMLERGGIIRIEHPWNVLEYHPNFFCPPFVGHECQICLGVCVRDNTHMVFVTPLNSMVDKHRITVKIRLFPRNLPHSPLFCLKTKQNMACRIKHLQGYMTYSMKFNRYSYYVQSMKPNHSSKHKCNNRLLGGGGC